MPRLCSPLCDESLAHRALPVLPKGEQLLARVVGGEISRALAHESRRPDAARDALLFVAAAFFAVGLLHVGWSSANRPRPQVVPAGLREDVAAPDEGRPGGARGRSPGGQHPPAAGEAPHARLRAPASRRGESATHRIGRQRARF